MKKTYIIIVLAFLFVSIGSLFIGKTDNRLILGIKNIFPQSVKNFLNDKIFFVFKQQDQINELKKTNFKLEDKIKLMEMNAYRIQKIQNNLAYDNEKNYYNLSFLESKEINGNDNSKYKISKYFFPSISWQLNDRKPGGYLFEYDDKIFTLTGNGEIGYIDIKSIDEKNDLILNKINSNITEIVDDQKVYSRHRFGFRGIMINQNKIYVSYQKKIEKNSYNISIISADLNFDNLQFEDFYSFKESSVKMSNHTGGKMVPYDENSFLFTIGDSQMFSSVQKDDSLFGKIVKINYSTRKVDLIAKGMRDTQGASFYKKSKVLVMTEHGPQGGDEINTLLESEFNQYVNFGWPVASYGKVKYNVIEELKYENHAENGFKEPAYWYKKNSIAPSAIINADGFFKNSDGDFFVSAMGNTPAPGRRSLHHIRFNDDFTKAEVVRIIPVDERVRDILYVERINRVVMILENTPLIAFLKPM